MIGKLIALPFVLIKRIIQVITGTVGLLFKGVLGTIFFAIGRVFAVVFGATVGMLLGRRHLAIRWFPRRKK